MRPFTVLTSVAAPMPEADVDTDIIFPARFLLLTDKAGLGRCAFHDKRFDAEGRERADFVLNQPVWRQAGILVAGPNFGCGSSREQAPWALADIGIRCIIAPGFGDIFRANCYANGLLPITLDTGDHARLMREAQAARRVTIDLVDCHILSDLTEPTAFDVPPRQRAALLAGLDEIGLIQQNEAGRIADFERRQQQESPWLRPIASASTGGMVTPAHPPGKAR